MLLSLLIIDDFLKDPWAALALDYDPARQHGSFPGLNCSALLDTAAMDSAVWWLLGIKLGPTPGIQHGACRLTCKGDKGRSGLHIDPASYSGILYLSRPEDCARADAGGTDFFRHKRSGLEAVPTDTDPARIVASGYADANALIEMWSTATPPRPRNGSAACACWRGSTGCCCSRRGSSTMPPSALAPRPRMRDW